MRVRDILGGRSINDCYVNHWVGLSAFLVILISHETIALIFLSKST